MPNILTDQGEFELLKEAYDGKSVTVGLYNEGGGSQDSTSESEDTIITDYNLNIVVGGGGNLDVEDNVISAGEKATVQTVQQTEPDRSQTYSRKSVTIDADHIRRDAGFKTSKDLSAKVEIPQVTFDVSGNERVVNAVFVIFDETDNLHFTAYLDQARVLNSIDDELTVSNIELVIE